MKWKYAAAAAVGTLAVLGAAQARISEADRQVASARARATMAALERNLNDRPDEMTRPDLHAPAGDVFAEAAGTRLDPFFAPAEPPQEASTPAPADSPPMDPAQAADAPPPLPGSSAAPEDAPGRPAPADEAPSPLPGAEDSPSLPSPTVVPGAPPDARPMQRVQESPTVLEAQPGRLDDLPPLRPDNIPADDLEPFPSRKARPVGRMRAPSPARVPRPGEALPGIARPASGVRAPSPFEEDPQPVSPTPGDGPTDDQARSLVRRLVQAELLGTSPETAPDSATLEDLANLLKVHLTSEFINRQRRYAAEVDALEGRVKKLREMIQRREENRDQIIDRRIQQLKVEAQGMGW